MKKCLACGMPLIKPEDCANHDLNADFCIHCVNEQGEVKSAEEIFQGGVEFFIAATGVNRELAKKLTRRNMNSLPYWQNKNEICLQGEEASDEEFQMAMEKFNN